MTHTAACNILNPANRHKRNTPAPRISTAESVTVKLITSFHSWLPDWSGVIRYRSGGASFGAASEPGTGTSHTGRPRLRSARHMRTGVHCGTRSTCVPCSSPPVSARKLSVRSGTRKRDAPRIPSVPGNVAFPSGPPHSFQWARGGPALFGFLSCNLRPGPCRIQSRTGRGLSHSAHNPGVAVAAGIRSHGRSLISSVNARSLSASPETESDVSVTSIRR